MKSSLALIGVSMLAIGPPALAADPAMKKPSMNSSSGSASNESSESKMGLSQGVDRLLADVYKRQKELNRAESEIASREVAVVELEKLIDERLASLEVGRAEIEERIASWESKGGDRIQKLAKVYAAMPASKAARLLETMDLDLAVAVLGKIKGKNSAQIFAVMNPKRALVMSQRMLRPLSASPASRGN